MLVSTSALLTIHVIFSLAYGERASQDSERARKLFVTNCATCHGETGDGKGTTQLDRPARSFMDGGFSFGNTPEALFKTISTGIPGSPMPGFDSSLSEEERKLVASYVVTLGPPIEEVKTEDMILAVHDRPLVVRGKLPALAEGLPEHPRGLLIGDPSGITFEYRVDDVRLLALRQGGFVERTDWTGRGGTALNPLGKVVHMVEGGKPQATFLSKGTPLAARLSGTQVQQHGVVIEYHLVDGGKELLHVREGPHVLTAAFGTGYQRDIGLLPGSSPVEVSVRTPAVDGATVLAKGGSKSSWWQAVRPAEGPPLYVEIDTYQPVDIGHGQLEARVALKGGEKDAGLSISVLVLVAWNDDVQKQLARWCEEK